MSPSPSVLIIEDNPALAESIAFALSTFGWSVVGTASSNSEALAALEEGRFSVAILDVDLGHEYSWPVATKLREAGIPFVFLTGMDGDEDVPPELRAQARLTKPVMPEALVKVLTGLLQAG